MSRWARTLIVAVAATLALSASAAAVPDAQLRPLNLRVAGGADVWQPDRLFRLAWDHPTSGGQNVPVAKIHLNIRDEAGGLVVDDRVFPWDDTKLDVSLAGNGRYTADIWLEGPGGAIGEPASTSLLFDSARPAPTRPLPPTGWVAGDTAPIVRFEHPAGPWPLSGIRGYAISLDRGFGSAPCADPHLCSLAETDLHGGPGDDTISLGPLPEGVNVVRAATVSGSGLRSLEISSAEIRVDATDPEVSLRAPVDWVDGPVSVAATATDALSGMAAAGGDGTYTAIAVDGGAPRVEPGAAATRLVTGEGVHRVTSYARDVAGNVGDRTPTAALVSIDETPPRVAFASSQDPQEPERIEATVSDPLSGPATARGAIGIRPAGSRQPFVALPTKVSRGRLVAQWDSDSFARRTYEFRATGFDAAGNATDSDRRADGARMVLVNPVKAPTQIAAGFGGARLVWPHCSRRDGRRHCRNEAVEPFGARPTSRTVPYGRRISFSGNLSTTAGATLAGLPIEIVERFGPGAVPAQRTTTVQTAADGTFEVRLRPGPGRRVEAFFAGNRTLTETEGGGVDLRVRTGVRMRSSAATARIGGAPVTFRGHASDFGAPIPPHGLLLELQFRLRDGSWSAFRTVRTDALGDFRYPYIFSDDDSRGIRFQFRAHVPAQAGWPYEPATSRPVYVTGR